MKPQVYFGIAIRLILLFSVGMLLTLATPYMREFFGDTIKEIRCDDSYDGCWNWGARHYWYFVMMSFLFVLSVINVIVGTVNLIDKHYPNKY